MADRLGVIACTIVARNYLPLARVLAKSYLDHHPDHEFVVVVTDGVPEGVTGDGYQLAGPELLDVSETDYLRMATSYSVAELAGAVKPLLLRRLLDRAPVVVYLQPDIQVFAPMPEVAELAANHEIVLTPRFLNPLPRDGREPTEAAILGEGMFDLGFLAVSRGARGFLDFWAERLRQDAVIDTAVQMFADQRWADQIPTLFRHTVIRDPGFNVAYWNLHERPLTVKADGTLLAGPAPVRFFHFSGYRPEDPWLLSRHCQVRPRVRLSEHPDLKRLCDDYRKSLLANGYVEPLKSVPYGFDTLPDGTKLTMPLRRMFRHAWMEAEEPDAEQLRFKRAITEIPPHPFGPDGGVGFQRWLASPSSPPEEAAGMNRLLMAVWANRGDLQRAFPWPCGADAAAYRQWCRTYGVQEKMVPKWALPKEPRSLRAPVDEFGVNIAGYLTAELGLGEMGRIISKVVERAGVPLVSVVEEHSLACSTALDLPPTAGRPRFPVTIMAVNADQTELLMASYPEVGHERYRIGLWAWELEDFPAWQHMGYDFVDEIWTVSEFCAKAFAKHSPVPVKVIPVPVMDPGLPPRPPRDPGKTVQFFFAFDYNSTGQRKNPWGVVTAFKKAFEGRDDVKLVIKATNGQLHAKAVERLLHVIDGDPRIELVERYLSVAELNKLYADSDCYVSLHRSEGFGLTVAEAMVRGMAVISTDYSSTTEFFNDEVGWPIPYRMVEVGPGWAPYQENAQWADPDLDAAAEAMREIADNPAEADRRGRAAREYVLRTRSPEAAAAWVTTQLRDAYKTWQERKTETSSPSLASTDPVLRPLVEAREAVRWRAETNGPSRLPLAPAMRRVVLRVIDHYDVHQRKVMATLTDGVQNALDRLNRRFVDTTDAQNMRIDLLENQVSDRIEQLTEQLGKVERMLDERLARGESSDEQGA
ncbi:glycosyltransferase family 4 protein [Kibdelosporangium persicum]|uniref:Glycosyltransferase involved in cell wall bisynthesis n=1 Tax=Kibdelosporangium persicum TaxID=2698649 RepID=A0ABX2EYD9_9PSEU|nr:glycosyltransferase [Kibdelosporangium persicum]NRN64056.1 Glycosyltransferase involved in cell wall bisynthesis [Kibdelosporangium persicum]